MTLSELVANHRIVISAGSGGVGKTTVAASVALWGALQGRRTVVITIDPARRLASSMGLAALGSDAAVMMLGPLTVATRRAHGTRWSNGTRRPRRASAS